MFTTEQRSWLNQFLGDNLAEPPDPPTQDKIPNQPGQPTPGDGNDRFGIAPAVIIPPIIDIVKDLTGQLTGTVIIQNLTKTDLTLDASSIPPNGKAVYDGKKPNPKIPAGGSDTFKLKTEKNLILISTEDVEATTRYFVGDPKTIWACHFHNPRIPLQENSADTNVTGDKATQFNATAQHTSGNDATFTFVLTGGGDGPPTPGGGTTTPLSCRVSVVNQTQATLFLRKQDKASGDYVTNAATSLAPGAKTDFVFAATPGGTDKEIRGLMSWDIGDPKQASWDLMWDNPQGSKNYTAGLLDPKDGPFHSLDQIDQGDENVPVTFTLSGGGNGPPPPQGGGAKATITLTNNTKSTAKLLGQSSDAGAFQGAPPPSIDPGKSAILVQSGDPKTPEKGCAGSLSYSLGDEQAPLWIVDWNNPPGPKNTANASVDPADPGLTTTATIIGEDDVAVAFTLAGELQPKPETEFTPPPKSKQPTLRKGDQSPDGWVEYAQTRLAQNGFKGPIDGKFDGAMEKRVHDFQAKNGLQYDGVIGNETWSALREGPKEPVGTDGRKPHTFEEKGAQARFVTEKPDSTGYFKNTDTYRMTIVSVGEQPIDKSFVTMLVTQPDKTSHTDKVQIGTDISPTPDGQGNFTYITVDKFSQRFRLKQGVDPLTCTMDAYIDEALGGDRWTGPITE